MICYVPSILALSADINGHRLAFTGAREHGLGMERIAIHTAERTIDNTFHISCVENIFIMFLVAWVRRLVNSNTRTFCCLLYSLAAWAGRHLFTLKQGEIILMWEIIHVIKVHPLRAEMVHCSTVHRSSSLAIWMPTCQWSGSLVVDIELLNWLEQGLSVRSKLFLHSSPPFLTILQALHMPATMSPLVKKLPLSWSLDPHHSSILKMNAQYTITLV